MNATFYNLILVTHIVGIILMAGATFIDYLTFKSFWSLFEKDQTKALVLREETSRFQKIMGFGMLLILLSGIGMMAYMHKVYGQQTWMQIKIGIVVLIIINGLGIRRMLGTKLEKLLTEKNLPFDPKVFLGIKTKLTLVHIVQLTLFLSVFVLSVFKFN